MTNGVAIFAASTSAWRSATESPTMVGIGTGSLRLGLPSGSMTPGRS